MAPRVERAPSTPTVGLDVVSGPRMSTPDVSSGLQQIGRAFADVGQSVQNIQTSIATTAAEDAMVGFERDKNKLLFDPKNGYFNTQGVNAVDGAEPTRKQLEQLASQYAQNLDSIEAQNLFNNAVKVRINRDQQSIVQHAAKGQKTYEAATLGAIQENAIEKSALYWNNPDEMFISLASGEDAVVEQADLLGVGNEAKNERLQNFRSSFASSAVESAIEAGDLAAAKDLMESFDETGMFEAPDKQKLDKKFETANNKMTVAVEVARIYDPGKSLTDMLNEGKTATDNPENNSEIRRQLKNQYEADKFARNEAQSDLYENLADQIEQGQFTVSNMSSEQLEILSSKQLESLKKIESNVASGTNVKTDWTVYNDLVMMPDEELARINPPDYYDSLGPTERNKLINAVRSAKNGGRDSEFSTGRSRATAINATIGQILGKKSSKYNDNDREFVNTFNQLLTNEIQTAEESKGSKLTPSEFESMLSKFTAKTIIEGGPFGLFNVERGLSDIPNDRIQILSSELRARNIPVTSGNLVLANQAAEEKGLFND